MDEISNCKIPSTDTDKQKHKLNIISVLFIVVYFIWYFFDDIEKNSCSSLLPYLHFCII